MEIFSARSFWLPVMTVTLVAALFGSILARSGRELRRMLAEQATLERELAALVAENETLRAERDALLSSPEAAERLAREDYGFTAPGEQVTEFEADVARAAKPAPEVLRVSRWQKTLMWPGLPRALPASAFVITAVVFALLNVASGVREHRAR